MRLIRILAAVRLALIPLALAKILLDRDAFPSAGYEAAAWTLLGAQAAVALALLGLAHWWRGRLRGLAALNVVADVALAWALMLVYAWEPAQELRALHFLVVLEAALFFRLRGDRLFGKWRSLASWAQPSSGTTTSSTVRRRRWSFRRCISQDSRRLPGPWRPSLLSGLGSSLAR
jgi:hypothetical protein